MGGSMVAFVAFYFILGFGWRTVVGVSFKLKVAGMYFNDLAGDMPRL